MKTSSVVKNLGFATLLILTIIIFLPYCTAGPRIKLGADILIEEKLYVLTGKRVGLITNHTGRLASGEFLLDALLAKRVNVTALFAPEHGVRGGASAGETVNDSVDMNTGVRIFSLYGRQRKPSPEMLKQVDVLVYHIQDVGARFYTYISTMALAMESAAEAGIPFVVLDRPNPLGGELVDGPIIEDSLKSFIGMLSIPVVYGLTCGELASMINGEGWLNGGNRVHLIVVPMQGWERAMRWSDTGLEWVAPSPNIPAPRTAVVYPSTCFIEATNLSEGRGTEKPFETIGAPFVDGDKLSMALHEFGFRCSPTKFTPSASKFSGQPCQGIILAAPDVPDSTPVLSGLKLLQKIHEIWPESVVVKPQNFARLLGKSDVLVPLLGGKPPAELALKWEAESEVFKQRSLRYRVYR